MKFRRHHNNKGSRKIRRGKTYDEVRRMAQRLGLPFGNIMERRRGKQTRGSPRQGTLSAGYASLVQRLPQNGVSVRGFKSHPGREAGVAIGPLRQLTDVPCWITVR